MAAIDQKEAGPATFKGISREGSSDDTELGASAISSSSVNEKALLRKIDRQLLPAVGILYLLSFLDRSNGWFTLFAFPFGFLTFVLYSSLSFMNMYMYFDFRLQNSLKQSVHGYRIARSTIY